MQASASPAMAGTASDVIVPKAMALWTACTPMHGSSEPVYRGSSYCDHAIAYVF
jgi:hypothetical protein